MKFNEGDLVIGKENMDGSYDYFSPFCVAEVTEIDNSDKTVYVEIISHEIDSDYVGEGEWVAMKDIVLKDAVSSTSTSSSFSHTLNSIPGTKIEYSGSKVKLYKSKGLI